MRNRRRKQFETKKRKKRTILFTLGILVVIYLFLTLIFGRNGLLRYVKLRSISVDIQREIRDLKKQNEEAKRHIEAIKKDSNLIEELARKQGITREGELIFRFEDE